MPLFLLIPIQYHIQSVVSAASRAFRSSRSLCSRCGAQAAHQHGQGVSLRILDPFGSGMSATLQKSCGQPSLRLWLGRSAPCSGLLLEIGWEGKRATKPTGRSATRRTVVCPTKLIQRQHGCLRCSAQSGIHVSRRTRPTLYVYRVFVASLCFRRNSCLQEP